MQKGHEDWMLVKSSDGDPFLNVWVQKDHNAWMLVTSGGMWFNHSGMIFGHGHESPKCNFTLPDIFSKTRNKEVLLRNRKRHTACAPRPFWFCSVSGVLPLSWLGGTTMLAGMGGYPYTGWATSRGYPCPSLGYPIERTRDQRPEYPHCGRTNKLKILPFRILRNVGGNKIVES